MKKSEKEYMLNLFLEQDENDDIVNLATEGFGITIYYTESNANTYKSIFDFESKLIFINRLNTNQDEAEFLVGYHIAEYILCDNKKSSIIHLDNMDMEVYQLAQKIYWKSKNIKKKQLKKGK